jgi:hypothetical protein
MAVVALFVPVFLIAQDADYLKFRSTIYADGRDTATENGFRAVRYGVQHWSSLLSYTTPGSTGNFQLEAFYWGDINFRNKIDNVGWSTWKTIWHSGNFTPGNYFASNADVWNADNAGFARMHFTSNGGTYIRGYGSQSIIFRNSTDATLATFYDNGTVGIGTTNTHGHKLAVAGSILAEKVRVKQQSAWPDYVFRSGYVLRSLEDLELFVLQHHHLPDVPSEKEVKENGVDVGEMNARLLKTVEELTLYIIQQDKKMKGMEERLLAIENQSEPLNK